MLHSALHQISYGLYIVSSIDNNHKLNGQIANSIFQVTATAPTIAISINRDNFTHQYISESSLFTISTLNINTPMEYIAHFGFKTGRDIDKFAGIKYEQLSSGAPVILENTNGYIECKVINSVENGTHTIFIGRVTKEQVLNDDELMTYAYYHRIKGGKAPKNAPTYRPPETDETSSNIYACGVCGYKYDPEIGDDKGGISSGTLFSDLPETWICPICGAQIERFKV